MKGYKFTNKKQSKMGIFSTILAIASIAMIGYGIDVSFDADGKGGVIIGILAFVSFLFSMLGTVLGIRSFKDDDVFYLFSWLGSVLNIIIFIFCLSMFLIGV
ncbi:MAG: hypothetical protein E7266_07360 [Lachnospiraceae bacterium]|nr:hypothetical protein [Lachnospiraceae bacterium]